jgi:hypothetical protein
MKTPYKSVTELCADHPNLAEYVGTLEGRLYVAETRNRLMNDAGNALYWAMPTVESMKKGNEKLLSDWVNARDWNT